MSTTPSTFDATPSTLDVPISVFQNAIDTRPYPFTLAAWIEATRTENRHTPTLLRLRQTKDDAERQVLKGTLPAATIGAVCEGGRKTENVTTRTGWIAIDADAKDNELKGERLRNEIARVDCVAYAALSASGRGAWGLVKVSNPDRQADHFEQLADDFKTAMGIILDESKGKNPNDLRYISYDPDGVFRRDAKTYTRLPAPKPPPTRRRLLSLTSAKASDAYARAALNGELETLARTGKGSRHHCLIRAASKLGQLVAVGMLDEAVVMDNLNAMAASIGLDGRREREVVRTIRDGLRWGREHPRDILRDADVTPYRTSRSRNPIQSN